MPVGQGVCGDEIFPREDLLKSEFYNDWLKGQAQCETSIGVSIIREETRTFVLSTCTSSADPDFNKEAAGRYTLLAPHLKRAFDFIRKRDLLAPERQNTQTLLDSIGVGLIYVSEQGRARQWNKSAEALMEAGFPVHVLPWRAPPSMREVGCRSRFPDVEKGCADKAAHSGCKGKRQG